jgi:hyaluronan synthase
MESEAVIPKQLYATDKEMIPNENRFHNFILEMNSEALKNTFSPAQKIESFLNNVFGNVSKINVLVLSATFLLLLGGGYMVYELQPEFYAFNVARMDSSIGFTFLIIASALLLFKIFFFLYKGYLYLRYKPIESVSDELLPTCTVIVPAYNEGKQVWETLLSIANSDYPEAKLQLLAIDDGSKDDTWYWMQEAKKRLGDRLSIFKQPENKGKRHALYRGFNMGTGEVFVTIDSDSVVKADTLRNLVSPFVTNENCGAVAGNVRVLNNQKAILPKMLNVSLYTWSLGSLPQIGCVCVPARLDRSAIYGTAIGYWRRSCDDQYDFKARTSCIVPEQCLRVDGCS